MTARRCTLWIVRWPACASMEIFKPAKIFLAKKEQSVRVELPVSEIYICQSTSFDGIYKTPRLHTRMDFWRASLLRWWTRKIIRTTVRTEPTTMWKCISVG